MVGAILVPFTLAASALAQNVKFEKYTLDNGLTVILHEDHHLPLACVNIWYKVGSKDEPYRRSGFAHLFEHLMFMGTERVPGNDFDVIMESGGGNNNASTAFDRTNYFSHGPAALLPTLLWLDADRLEDLGRTMTSAKVDKQRDVVRNERRQSVENQPYGKAELKIEDLLYPPDHPYHNPTIGSHEDLNAASLEDVQEFFANFYVPNNASLCVAGDFDPVKIKPLIAKLFGDLPRGQTPMRRTAPPVQLDGVKRATLLDQVQLPALEMAFHAPAIFAAGQAEMTLVGRILADGKSSRLYKRLVLEEKLAREVKAYEDANLLDTMFRVDVTGVAGADLNKIESIVDNELINLIKDGVKSEELERYKAGIEREKVAALQSIEARADKLNEYEFYLGNPDGFAQDLERFRKVTPESLRNYATLILNLNKRVIMRVLPEQAPRLDSARDQRPEPTPQATFAPQPPESATLSNGLKLMVFQRPELPLVAVEVAFKPGGALDPRGKAGAASLLSSMLTEGAGERDTTQFADAMQMLGADIDFNADHEAFLGSLSVLKRNFDPAAALLADAIRKPRFEDTAWERVHRLQLEQLSAQEDEPAAVAGVVALRSLYGADNPYGWPVDGTPDTVKQITLDDVKSLYPAVLRPDDATILLAGDITLAEARATFEKLLGDWKPVGPLPAPQPIAKMIAPGAPRVVIVDRPNAVQTVECVILPGPRYIDPQRPAYFVLNTIIGCSFTSRLNQNLREDKGYTYGARSRFAMDISTGQFTARAAIRADVTGPALREMLMELNRTAAGDISPEEAAKAVETVRTTAVQQFADLHSVVEHAAELALVGLPFETIGLDMAALCKLSAGDLNQLAAQSLPLKQAVIVLVGDKATILAQIGELGLPTPEEVDEYGEPVKE
ncbi:MAG: insulinase family protein [Fimbriimonas ginsengisoli]|nr:insulinase family protein [Fimbriimonas ginsengisoli]